MTVDALIFVEDPGAADFAADLPHVLAEGGLSATLLATGDAIPHLARLGVDATPVPPGATARGLIAAWRPRVVVVGTAEDSRTLGLALVNEARRQGLTTVGLVDAYPNAGHRFRGIGDRALAHAPDWLVVPSEATRLAYVELGFEATRCVVTGHPHDDRVRAALPHLRSLDREALRAEVFPDAGNRRVLLFLSETNVGLHAEQYVRDASYTLHGTGRHRTRTEIVLDELLAAVDRIEPRPYLALRPHPKNRPDDLADFVPAFDSVTRAPAALEHLWAADAVVGMTTTLLGEAAALGRPTLAIVPREEERAWIPAAVATRGRVASTTAETRAHVAAVLEGPPLPPEAGLDSPRARIAAAIEAVLRGPR